MPWHRNPKVNEAIEKFEKALKEAGQPSGQTFAVVVVPDGRHEEVYMSVKGQRVPNNRDPMTFLGFHLDQRDRF